MKRRRIDVSPGPDTEPPMQTTHTDNDASYSNLRPVPHFRVAIDFGTTFTTIAFMKGEGTKDDILTIENFPGDRCLSRNGTQVPTEIWYMSKKRETNSTPMKRRKASEEPTSKILYGYEITRHHELSDCDPAKTDYSENGLVTKMKLLLDPSRHVKHLKEDLTASLESLKSRGLINKHEDVLRDLLVRYLRHTRNELAKNHGLQQSSTANATMSAAVQEAMKEARLGMMEGNICNLFMINEAEAAALYVLGSNFHNLKRGQTFILLDCGGGTTDVGTYTIAHEHPLRLAAEVLHPDGAVCGSSDLNERMRTLAVYHLMDERYLEQDGYTISTLIEAEIMPHFETEIKRAFNLPNKDQSFSFRLRGLKASGKDHMLKRNAFTLSHKDMLAIFQPSLVTVEQLMENQIVQSLLKKTDVDKVVLVGGFGDSPALREHLADSLSRINQERSTNIDILFTPANTGAAGVATGAVMRMHNKENGPRRVPRQSIGVIRHVPWDPTIYSAEILSQSGLIVSELDGEEYIWRTIFWVIKVGQGELEPVHRVSFTSRHTFDTELTRWIAKEELFASDTCTEDFFTRSHVKNKGKTTAIGIVEFDVTHLRTQIEMSVPINEENEARERYEDNESDIEERYEAQERYEVDLLIEITLIDRNLEFTARWKPDENGVGSVIQGSQTYFNLVSAFGPGTA